MYLDFLCQQHRNSLQGNPDDAYQFWSACDESLKASASHGEPSPYQVSCAGSALEAAGIYLLGRDACEAHLIHRYAASALTLIKMLQQLASTQMTILVIASATALLEQVARAHGDRRAVIESIGKLTSAGRKFTYGYSRRANRCQPFAKSTAATAEHERAPSSMALRELAYLH